MASTKVYQQLLETTLEVQKFYSANFEDYENLLRTLLKDDSLRYVLINYLQVKKGRKGVYKLSIPLSASQLEYLKDKLNAIQSKEALEDLLSLKVSEGRPALAQYFGRVKSKIDFNLIKALTQIKFNTLDREDFILRADQSDWLDRSVIIRYGSGYRLSLLDDSKDAYIILNYIDKEKNRKNIVKLSNINNVKFNLHFIVDIVSTAISITKIDNIHSLNLIYGNLKS